jgi:hypothetical protein
VKPSPQSAPVVQGKRYRGTHDRVVVVVQGSGVGVGAGSAHFSPGGQAGSAAVTPAQLSVVCAKHTIPDAQSLSALHGRGVQEEIVSGSHFGCVQVSPGAHAMAGQGVASSETWHEKPLGQSLLCEQVFAAQAPAGASTTPVAKRKESVPRSE